VGCFEFHEINFNHSGNFSKQRCRVIAIERHGMVGFQGLGPNKVTGHSERTKLMVEASVQGLIMTNGWWMFVVFLFELLNKCLVSFSMCNLLDFVLHFLLVLRIYRLHKPTGETNMK